MVIPNCPRCNDNRNVVKIVYGYPSPEVMQKTSNGEVKLGGCSVELDAFNIDKISVNSEGDIVQDISFTIKNPKWFCKEDNLEF